MRLIEADGKRLLRDIGVAVPQETISSPCFVKAQVLKGGRGKAGLVQRVAVGGDIDAVKKDITSKLGDLPNAGFLIEQETPHVREWFLSIDLDRAAGDWRVNIGAGGIDVSSATSRSLLSYQDEKFGSFVQQLADGMRKHDLQSLEINPLAELADGSFVALDAKIVLDDQATARHPEWSSFVRLDPSFVELDGDIALILSGGGASLVALDALQIVGGHAANYVEISGNPDYEFSKKTAARVFSKPGLKAVWVAGSYANFTDIAATLSAVRDAYDEARLAIPFIVRRDGPRADEAEMETKTWAEKKGIAFAFHRADTNLETSARVLMDLMNNI